MSELISFAMWGITGTGDNRQLMQKVAKEIVTGIALQKFRLPVLSTNKNWLSHTDHFNSTETLMDLIKIKEIRLEKKLAHKTKELAKMTGSTMQSIFS